VILLAALRWVGDRALARPKLSAVIVLLGGVVGYLAVAEGRGWWHWRRAEAYARQRQFTPAEASLAVCLEIWPRSAAVHFALARCQRRAGRPGPETYQHLEHALRLGQSAEEVVLERYLLRAQRGELADVEKHLLTFIHKRHPDHLLVRETLTDIWMIQHRLGEALAQLGPWIEERPDDREPVRRRAWVHERLQDFPPAIADYERALALDPQRDAADGDRLRLRLAILLLRRLRVEEALPHFEILAARRPELPSARFGLARCQLQLAQTEEGTRLLEELLDEHPNYGPALSEMGRLKFEAGDAAAESWLRRAVAAQPFDKPALFNLKQCLERRGQAAEAKKLELRLERMTEDERHMQKLMADVLKSPHDPALRTEIGVIFLGNGLVDDGVTWLRSALRAEPTYIPAHQALLEHFERHDPAQAARHAQALRDLGVPRK
jgi:tetratricopeptide (TPR) repeat protein